MELLSSKASPDATSVFLAVFYLFLPFLIFIILYPGGAISAAGLWIETRWNLFPSAGTLMLNSQLAFM